MDKHSGQRIFYCPYCGQFFAREHAFLYHKSVCRNKPRPAPRRAEASELPRATVCIYRRLTQMALLGIAYRLHLPAQL